MCTFFFSYVGLPRNLTKANVPRKAPRGNRWAPQHMSVRNATTDERGMFLMEPDSIGARQEVVQARGGARTTLNRKPHEPTKIANTKTSSLAKTTTSMTNVPG